MMGQEDLQTTQVHVYVMYTSAKNYLVKKHCCLKGAYIHYDVMGVKVSSKWRKYMETRMFLYLHIKNVHVSTKTCVFPCIFSI